MTAFRRLAFVLSIMTLLSLVLPAIAATPRKPPARKTGRTALPKDYDSLIKLFESERRLAYNKRFRTITQLGSCKDPRTVGFLIKNYGSETDLNTRKAFIRAIGRHKVREAANFLIMQYNRPKEGDVKAAIITALANMPQFVPFDLFKKAILGGSYEVKRDAAKAIGKIMKKEAIETLLHAYAREPKTRSEDKINPRDNKARMRRQNRSMFLANIRNAICSIKKKDLLGWIAVDLLASGEKHHKASLDLLVPLMGSRKETRALENLLDLLKGAGAEVRALAAYALGEIGDISAIDGLIEAAATDRSAGVKAACASAIGQFGVPAGREILLKLAGSKAWGVRSAAIKALGSFTGKDIVDLAIEALGDKAWQVRIAAVAALGRLRARESIEPLIEAMKKNDGRIRQDIAEVLSDLLEADFGLNYKEWAKWWKRVGEKFVIMAKKPEDKKIAAKDHKKPYKTSVGKKTPKFFGAEVVSTRVIFIIDISGSMNSPVNRAGGGRPAQGGRKIDMAKSELVSAVRALRSKVMFNMYSFETEYSSWKKRMVRATPGAKRDALKWIQSMKPKNATNIFDPLEDALSDPNVDTIYLLSDGSPNQGKWTTPTDILREVKKINQFKNVKINTITFGPQSRFMEDLAKQNGGEYIKK